MKNIAKAIATTGGSGYFPIAPGTVGAAIAVIILWFLPALSWITLLGGSVLLYFLGVWASDVVAQEYAEKDPGLINWDEVVGQCVACLALPKQWPVYLAAFLFFRFFDVWKPVPVRTAELLPGGWGIMTDDIIAGVYTLILVHAVIYFV